MYGWLWRKLPFGIYGKIGGSLLLVIAAAALLWWVVFPKVDPLLPWDQDQVQQNNEPLPYSTDDFEPSSPGPTGAATPAKTPTKPPTRTPSPTRR